MAILFSTIFAAGFILLLAFWAGTKLKDRFYPFLSFRSDLKRLLPLIQDGRFDHFVVQNALRKKVTVYCQKIPPFKIDQQVKPQRVSQENLISFTDRFIDTGRNRLLLILGESGMGKTSFCITYFLRHQKKSKHRKFKVILIPLSLHDAEDRIADCSDKKNCILFLDGFNEDPSAVTNRPARLRRLLTISKKYRKVILTCSSDFFPRDKRIRVPDGLERISAGKTRNDQYYEFLKIYISPISYLDLKAQVKNQFTLLDKNQKKQALNFLETTAILNINFFISNYLKFIFTHEHLPYMKSEIYEKMIRSWIAQEKKWSDKAQLKQFLEYLSIEIYLGKDKRKSESIKKNEMVENAASNNISIHSFSSTPFSLIQHTPPDHYKFIHRSVMEYCFIKQLVLGNSYCYQKPLTDQMTRFLFEILENRSSKKLSREFEFFSKFSFAAQGMPTIDKANGTKNSDLFRSVLEKYPQFNSLRLVNRMTQNPVFHEFGWEPQLYDALQKAGEASKPVYMTSEKTNSPIVVHPNKIEITKPGRENKKVLVSEKDISNYGEFLETPLILHLIRLLGHKGIMMLNAINTSKIVCMLPDLKTPGRFILFFRLEK